VFLNISLRLRALMCAVRAEEQRCTGLGAVMGCAAGSGTRPRFIVRLQVPVAHQHVSWQGACAHFSRNSRDEAAQEAGRLDRLSVVGAALAAALSVPTAQSCLATIRRVFHAAAEASWRCGSRVHLPRSAGSDWAALCFQAWLRSKRLIPPCSPRIDGVPHDQMHGP
jgi:hypothetical protein